MTHTKFKFRPADVLIERLGGYTGKMDVERYFAAYQWFVRKLYEFAPGHCRYEWLNDTSGQGCTEPSLITDLDQPKKRLASLLRRVGEKSECGEFLGFCGLREWSDLADGEILHVEYCDEFPAVRWFQLRGREFNYSPNNCHPDARWIWKSGLTIDRTGNQWGLVAYYSYPYDSASWNWSVGQKIGESLADFTRHANHRLDSVLLLPTLESDHHRLARLRQREHRAQALSDIFRDREYALGDWSGDLAELTKVPISLNKKRLAVLTKWAQPS